MWQLEEEGMTTKATLSSSSIECLVMSSNFSYSPNKEIPKLKRLFVCWMLNVDWDKILQTSPAGLQGLNTERSEANVVR